MTAVAYIRRSARGEAQASETLQRETVAQLAAKRGDTVTHVYRDWGQSGGSETRPEYLRMLAHIEADHVTAVYAYDSDRLARDIWLLSGLMRLAKRKSVRIYTAGGELTDDDTRTLHLMRGVMDDGELVKITKRNRANVERAKARGDDMGVAPFGYTKQREEGTGRVVMVKTDPDGITHVIEAYKAAGTIMGAAKRLNAEGFPSKYGKSWVPVTVKGIIEREAPELTLHVTQGRRATHRPRFLAGRLLRCYCGGPMSPGSGGIGSGDTYYCNRGQRGLHGRPTNIAETRLMPWVKAEAARFRGPEAVIVDGERYDDSADRASLGAVRSVMGEDAYALAIANLDAKREAHGERLELVETLPATIDWDTDPPEAVNGVLRALWSHVQLGPDLMPLEADWRVPQWRADG